MSQPVSRFVHRALAAGARSFASLTLAALVAASSPSRADWSTDPTNSNLLSTNLLNPQGLSETSDGAGGAYFWWSDQRGSGFTNRVIVTRVVPPGVFGAGWTPSSLPICATASVQLEPSASFDGHALFVAWTDNRSGDNDVYVTRVTPNGVIASGWPAGGVRLSTTTTSEHAPVIAADGLGGATIAWVRDVGPGDSDVQAAHVDSNGTATPAITAAGGPNAQTAPAIMAYDTYYYPGHTAIAYQDNAVGNYNIRIVELNLGAVGWGPSDVCVQSGDQTAPRVTTDGFFGQYVAWNDNRGAVQAVYLYGMQLYSGGLNLLFTWPYLSGAQVSSLATGANLTSLATDGAGNALVGWEQTNGALTTAYVHRYMSSGSPATGFGYYGQPASSVTTSNQHEVQVANDGSSGAFVVWRDDRNGGQNDIFAQHVGSDGTLGINWPAAGIPVGSGPYSQYFPSVTPDGTGSFIAAFRDDRYGPSSSDGPTANRVDHFGVLGDPRPVVTDVADLKGDQGGEVKLSWNHSYLDADPRYPITSYWIWRDVPTTLAEQALRAGARMIDEAASAAIARGEAPGPSPGERLFTTTHTASVTSTWEYVTSQPASGFAAYSAVLATPRDSMPGSSGKIAYLVQARAATGAFWNSSPDTGYSVDNLAPALPAPFDGRYSGGATALHWGQNHESDLAGYKVYRGASAGFVPGPGNRISSQPDTGYADPGPAGAYYKLSAIDIHGNESPYAVLTPSGTTAVDPSPGAVLAFERPSPDPASARTTLRFTLPAAGVVRLTAWDASGRRVATIAEGQWPAGAHDVTWDLHAAGRDAPAGLYFLRLEVAGQMLVRRLVVLR